MDERRWEQQISRNKTVTCATHLQLILMKPLDPLNTELFQNVSVALQAVEEFMLQDHVNTLEVNHVQWTRE